MGPGMMRGGEKAKDFRGTIRKLVQYLRKYQILILIVFCFAAAGAVFSIIGPKILGTVTTEVFEGIMAKITGTGEGINFDSIARTMLILLGLYVLSALFIYIQGWIMSGISAKITYKFRQEISRKINRLPLKYFDKTSQGDVMSRVTNDVDTISRTLNQSLSRL